MDIHLIHRAVQFASFAHHNLAVASEVPYHALGNIPRASFFFHPFSVGLLLVKHECPDEWVAAGVLHDCLRETRVAEQQLRAEFGDGITDLVIGCEAFVDALADQPPGQHDRAVSLNHPVAVVSCADQLQHLTGLIADYEKHGPGLWSRIEQQASALLAMHTWCRTFFSRRDPPHEIFTEYDGAAARFQTMIG